MSNIPQVKLNNGITMPQLGLGVFAIPDGKEIREAMSFAFDEGYRSIDTATVYGNEKGVGQAIKESRIPREEIFLTTKVWNNDQEYDSTLEAFQQSMDRLGVDYLDLYLIHWPVKGKFNDTWRALEKLLHDGLIRSIGVSNFQVHHLEALFQAAEIIPAVNQIEQHPYLLQKELRDFCAMHDIKIEAWSPLGRGAVLDDKTLIRLGQKYGKTSAQVTLRWQIQHDIITIPKSSRPERITENISIFDFNLEPGDMAVIDGLNRNHRIGPDPDNFHFDF